MNALPALPVVVALGLIVGPPLVLIHELGHAAAALWLTDGPVVVRLGANRRRLAIRAGRLQVETDELVSCGGWCSFDPDALSRRGLATIALAGPAASLAGATITAWLSGRTGGVARDVLATATLGGVFAGIVNALPLTYRERNDRPAVWLDGRHALEALRRSHMRPAPPTVVRDVKAGPIAERWAADVDAAAERARVERVREHRNRRLGENAERAATSIPPPGF